MGPAISPASLCPRTAVDFTKSTQQDLNWLAQDLDWHNHFFFIMVVWSSADLVSATPDKITEFFTDVHPLFALSYTGGIT